MNKLLPTRGTVLQLEKNNRHAESSGRKSGERVILVSKRIEKLP